MSEGVGGNFTGKEEQLLFLDLEDKTRQYWGIRKVCSKGSKFAIQPD